ncbi:C40 family peptidase [Desulfosporosinus fructosivorans]
MKTILNKMGTFLFLPVVSAFLLVIIITAVPTTVEGDSSAKTIQKAMGDLYPKAIQTAEAVVPVEVKNTPELETTSTASTPPPTTSAPVITNRPVTPKAQVSPQPSRSSNSLTSAIAPAQTSKASAIIATGKQYIGVKYLYGGTTPSGFDCSGFVQYVFAKNGINLPRVSRDQYKVGTSVSFSNLKPGDLVFFSLAKNGVVDHVGIYVGNGQFINASSSKGVTIYTLGTYWKSAYLGARSIL